MGPNDVFVLGIYLRKKVLCLKLTDAYHQWAELGELKPWQAVDFTTGGTLSGLCWGTNQYLGFIFPGKCSMAHASKMTHGWKFRGIWAGGSTLPALQHDTWVVILLQEVNDWTLSPSYQVTCCHPSPPSLVMRQSTSSGYLLLPPAQHTFFLWLEHPGFSLCSHPCPTVSVHGVWVKRMPIPYLGD